MSTTERISFDGLERFHAAHSEPILALARAALAPGRVLRGSAIGELEGRCREQTGRAHAVAVASATDGIALALRALDVGPGDEVIVPAFSFIASVSPVLMVGAVPVFVDVHPDTLLMDLAAARRAASARTRAVIAVHLYGQCVPLDELVDLSETTGVPVIEDAAQAFGASWRGRPAGSTGALSVFSFDPTKVVGGIDTGGMVLSDDAQLADRVRQLSLHGMNPRTGRFERLGYNSQMGSANAAVVAWRASIEPERSAVRRAAACRYADGLADLPGVRLIETLEGNVHNFHKLVVRATDRAGLAHHLASRGIETKIHYAYALPDTGVVQSSAFQLAGGEPRVARLAATEVLSLPMHAELSADEIDRVIAEIRAFCHDRA